jgi:hypoxanthine phosphoribosyltransferase
METISAKSTFFAVVLALSFLTPVKAMDWHNASEQSHKKFVKHDEVHAMCKSVYDKIQESDFAPDLLVGIARGGLEPLAILSNEQMFDTKNTRIINLSSYDGQEQSELKLLTQLHAEDYKGFKNILVVDDVADSGKSLKFAVAKLSALIGDKAAIKIATLFYKKKSVVVPDYYAEETDKWIVFPWEKP